MTLDLLSWSPRVSVPREDTSRPSIDERFRAFHSANPHVFAELLKLAREQLDAGATFISVKALWEAARVSLRKRSLAYDADFGADGYKLNNTHTASYGRLLIEHEPRLAGVIRLRRRKHGE